MTNFVWLLAQDDNGAGAAIGGAIFLLIYLLPFFAIFAGLWAVFAKAGKPGWAAIVPIYNVILLLEIVGKPIWWIVLLIVPCVQFFVWILLLVELGKSFGKDTMFLIGMVLLPFIFIPILGFGDSKYLGPAK